MRARCIGLAVLLVFAGLVPLLSAPASAAVSVTVIAPDGGETLWVGGQYTIRWTTSGSSSGKVILYYSTDSGTTWMDIDEVPHQMGEQEYKWLVPDNVTSKGRVMVFWFRSLWSWPADSSDADFTIAKLILPPLILTKPAAPTDLVAAGVGLSSIQLNWTDNSTVETGFKIERAQTDILWTQVATVGANVTTYTDEGLTAASEYSYRVRAYNALGNSAYSNIDTASTFLLMPLLGPAAPTNLAATPVSMSRIELEWEDKSTNETGFKLERRSDGAFAQIATVGANVTVYLDTGLFPGTDYEYRVRAYNFLGNSAYSNVVPATTLVPDDPEPEPSETVVLRFYINQTGYYANDVLNTMDTTPIIRHGRTLLPIRYVAENIGADVSWDPVERKAMVVLGTTTVEMWLNQNMARIDGVMVPLDAANPSVVPISIPPGRTMLPLRFVAEALGCEVQWQSATQQATVTYPAP